MKTFIKKTIKSALLRYHSWKHHRSYLHLLRINHIENRKAEKEAEWKQKWSGLTIKPDPVYYRLFSQYIGADMNILPEDISHDVIEPILNPPRFSKYYADKNIFDRLFPINYLPQTLLRRMNGFYYDATYNRIKLDETNLQILLGNYEGNKIIIKPSIEGSSGRGVNMFQKNTKGIWFQNTHNHMLSLEYLDSHYGRDFIIQEALEQHDSINYFNSTSINTLRLTLYRSVKTDECIITSAIIRIGKNGSVVDNAHAGGCFVGINVSTGILEKVVLNQWGEKQTLFNNINFNNFHQIPTELWNKVLDFAKSIGQYVPHHRLLALDIMIDKVGNPRLIEFNVEYYSMWLFQFSVGSAFGNYTDEIIDYCKSRLNSLEYQLLF